jgi:large subunit ribosomal protein L10
MAINKEKKKEIIEELRSNIAKQEVVFFINFKGIKGNDSAKLRSELFENQAKVVIAKKTLAKIAFSEEKIDFDPLTLEKEAGFVFGFEDVAKTAKVLCKFDKEGVVSVLGGFCEGKALTADEAKMIADLPTREELLAKMVGSIASPISGFMQVLQGNTRGLITVLSKIKA